jgi:hypothetical protein
MLTWIFPEVVGTATCPIENSRIPVSREIAMNKEDRQVMEAHDIMRTRKDVFSYKAFNYDRLEDAVRFARLDIERDRVIATRSSARHGRC